MSAHRERTSTVWYRISPLFNDAGFCLENSRSFVPITLLPRLRDDNVNHPPSTYQGNYKSVSRHRGLVLQRFLICISGVIYRCLADKPLLCDINLLTKVSSTIANIQDTGIYRNSTIGQHPIYVRTARYQDTPSKRSYRKVLIHEPVAKGVKTDQESAVGMSVGGMSVCGGG